MATRRCRRGKRSRRSAATSTLDGSSTRRARCTRAIRGDAALLASCHRSVLRAADELGAGSVAFPAISTGIYGYPVDEAAPIAVGTVRDTETAVALVRFVLFSEGDLEIFREALGTGP